MKKLWLLAMLLSWVFSVPMSAQPPKEDILTGTFANKQNALLLSVKSLTANTYEGFIEYQGRQYPFSGTRLLGMLSGQYIFNGATATFSLARVMGVYYLTSDGVSLEMERTAATPVETVQKSAAGAQPTSAGTATLPVPTSAPLAEGPRILDPYGSFSFQLPRGWSHTVPQGSNILITHSDFKAQISLIPHSFTTLKEIRDNTFDIRDAGTNTDLTVSIRDYGTSGLFIRYEGQVQGQALIIEIISLIAPAGGGINMVSSALRPDYTAEIETALKTIANSLQFVKSTESSAVKEWKQRLSNKQLLYLYTSNGLSDKIQIDLCSNGRFAYNSDGSYTSGGYAQFSYAGNDANTGTWKIISKNTFSVLVLFYGGGTVVEYTLTNRSAGNEINLNGKRYFIRETSACN